MHWWWQSGHSGFVLIFLSLMWKKHGGNLILGLGYPVSWISELVPMTQQMLVRTKEAAYVVRQVLSQSSFWSLQSKVQHKCKWCKSAGTAELVMRLVMGWTTRNRFLAEFFLFLSLVSLASNECLTFLHGFILFSCRVTCRFQYYIAELLGIFGWNTFVYSLKVI
jgi:hypothetical protein